MSRRRSATVTYERVFLVGASEGGEVFMAGKFEIFKDNTARLRLVSPNGETIAVGTASRAEIRERACHGRRVATGQDRTRQS